MGRMRQIGLVAVGMLIGIGLFARTGVDTDGTQVWLNGTLNTGTNMVIFGGVSRTNWPTDGSSGTTNANGINVAFTPTNYTSATPDVEAHLVGIDGKIETNRIAILAGTNINIRSVGTSNYIDNTYTYDDAAVKANNAATSNAIPTTAAQVGAVATNDERYLAALTNETYLGTIVGATVTESSGPSSITTNAGVLEFIVRTNAVGGVGTTNASGINVAFTPTNYTPATPDVEAHLVGIDSKIVTNRIAITDGTNIVWTVDEGGTNHANCTYVYDDTALKGATGSLDTAVSSLNNSTGNLNIAVTALKGATNDLNNATNALQIQATALKGATGAINIVANAALPTNNPAYQNMLTNTATKAQGATADAALPASSTNALKVTQLQITGGSPTPGAVLVTTNSAGQAVWQTNLTGLGVVSYSAPSTKIISMAGQTTNTTQLVVTGVGFKPKGCTMYSFIYLTKMICQGFVDSLGGESCIGFDSSGLSVAPGAWSSYFITSTGQHYTDFVSFDDDGITFNRGVNGSSPSTETITYRLIFFR